MTLTAFLIILGTVVLAIAIIKTIDWLSHRKVRSIEQEHLGAGVEADRRKTVIEYNGNKTTI